MPVPRQETEPVLTAWCTLPWTYFNLGQTAGKFSLLTVLIKKPYFLNVFAGANPGAPGRILPIPPWGRREAGAARPRDPWGGCGAVPLPRALAQPVRSAAVPEAEHRRCDPPGRERSSWCWGGTGSHSYQCERGTQRTPRAPGAPRGAAMPPASFQEISFIL